MKISYDIDIEDHVAFSLFTGNDEVRKIRQIAVIAPIAMIVLFLLILGRPLVRSVENENYSWVILVSSFLAIILTLSIFRMTKAKKRYASMMRSRYERKDMGRGLENTR